MQHLTLTLLGHFQIFSEFGQFPNGLPWGRQPWYYVKLWHIYREAEGRQV